MAWPQPITRILAANDPAAIKDEFIKAQDGYGDERNCAKVGFKELFKALKSQKVAIHIATERKIHSKFNLFSSDTRHFMSIGSLKTSYNGLILNKESNIFLLDALPESAAIIASAKPSLTRAGRIPCLLAALSFTSLRKTHS